MEYVKIENGQVTEVGLPITGTLKNGSSVSGYKLLPDDVLAEEGWIMLIDNVPEHDNMTEYAEHVGYQITDSKVISLYEIKPLNNANEPVPVSLEDKLNLQQEQIFELQNTINFLLGI